MKSIEFITEHRSEEDFERLGFQAPYIKFIQELGRNCKPYLSQFNSVEEAFINGLYRGIRNEDNFAVKNVRLNDRKPLGMNPGTMKDVNNYFKKEFGAPFRFSALCTGEKMLAQAFGDPYVIFPAGDYRFLWSPQVEDLNRATNKFYVNLEPGEPDKIVPDLIPAKVQYTDKDLQGAIESGNEVMVRCNQYYALRYNRVVSDFWMIKEIIEEL